MGRLNLTIEVQTIDFDTEACSIRLSGRNVKESPHVKMGAHHTLEMELHRAFTLEKECWDMIALKRISDACNPAKSADLAAVVMQPGLAHVCLVTTNMTVIRSKVEKAIPRKRPGFSGHGKAVLKFFDDVVEAVVRHIDFAVVKCVLVASPGFTRWLGWTRARLVAIITPPPYTHIHTAPLLYSRSLLLGKTMQRL